MLLDVRAWWRDDLLPRGRELAGGNDDVLVVGAGFAAMMFTYWAYGLAWLAVDLARAPACLMRRRSQPARPFRVEGTSYAPPLSALLRNVVVNQWVGSRSGLFGVYVSAELPAWREVLLQAICAVLLTETTFYWSHRLLHMPALYRRVHKTHHEFKAPCALAAIYAHPLEAFVGNGLAVIGVGFVLRFHIVTFVFGMIIGWIETCSGHSGYQLLPHKGNFHDLHHEKFTVNFGNIGLWDSLLKTSDKATIRPRNKQK